MATLSGVAGHRPEAITSAMQQRPDGGWEVRLHDVARSVADYPSKQVWVPTGESTTFEVTPDLPVHVEAPSEARFASTGQVAWPAVLEKAFAAEMGQRSPRSTSDGSGSTTGYERLHQGGTPDDSAYVLARLTGQPAAAVMVDHHAVATTDEELAQVVAAVLQGDRPAVVATASTTDDPWPARHPGGLMERHAYEATTMDADSGHVVLRDPRGFGHPDPVRVADLYDHAMPYLITTTDERGNPCP